MSTDAGASVVGALVALVLVALGAAAIAVVATTTAQALVLARHDAVATGLALARLDELRAGPRTTGTDLRSSSDGTMLTRRWHTAFGRGRPDALDVTVTWSGHRIDLVTKALP